MKATSLSPLLFCLLCILPQAKAATEDLGTLPGGVVVDNTGHATYAIPLDVSPGTGAVQPSLSLVYNSGGV